MYPWLSSCGTSCPEPWLLALWLSLVLLVSLGRGPATQLWKLPQTLGSSLDPEGPSVFSAGPPRWGGHASATPGAA